MMSAGFTGCGLRLEPLERVRALLGARRGKDASFTWVPRFASASDGKLRSNAQQQDRRANAKFGEVLQLRHADAFVFKKCAVSRFQVTQPDDVVLDFQR